MSNLETPQGWYDDPTRRFQRRWFDGTGWTDHVANGAQVTTDPMQPAAPSSVVGGPPTQRLAPPTFGGSPPSSTTGALGTAGPTPGDGPAVATSPDRSFLDSLGPNATGRSAPDFAWAMGGIGGVLVGGGLVALIGQSGERFAIVLAGLATFGAALAVMLFVVAKVRYLASPAVSAATIGIFATAIGLIVSDDSAPSSDAPAHVFLLAGLLCLVVWALPGFRGRPLLLGIGLVVVPLSLAGLVAGGEACDSFDTDCNAFENAAGSAGLSSGAGIVLALIGFAMLFGVRKLDSIGRHGLATTVAAACIINLVIGAFLLAIDLGSTGGPLLVALAGVALGVVGHLGGRRGLTWTGAALAAGGLSTAIFDLVDADSGTVGGILAIVTGAVVIGAPYVFVSLATDRQRAPRSTQPPTTDD